MSNPSSQLILLLPERRRFSGQPISRTMASSLARADRLEQAQPGEREQLLRYFELLPRGWPMAAITRDADVGDAGQYTWLRADPVFVRPDMHGVRLMAWGNLGLSADEAEQLLGQLRPLFGDVGFSISAGAAHRWYVRLPRDARLPSFAAPTDALGEDILVHLPEGQEGARWRMLLNEAQIVLHNHIRNAERAAAGLFPVNSIWFWGGGVLPDSVKCRSACVVSEEAELLALARLAGVSLQRQETGSTLIDLRRERNWASLESQHLLPAFASLRHRHASLLLDFADGSILRAEHRQRWRLWRRPVDGLQS